MTGGQPNKNLEQLAERMFSPWEAPATNITLRLQYHYWEAHIIGAPLFPSGVKFLIGVFPDLFGTAAGRSLQEWATTWGWCLVWALGSNLPDDDLNFYGARNQTEFKGNARLLDPHVLASSRVTNLTVVAGIGSKFSDVWAQVASARTSAGLGVSLDPARWSAWWDELRGLAGAEVIDVQPLRPRRCVFIYK